MKKSIIYEFSHLNQLTAMLFSEQVYPKLFRMADTLPFSEWELKPLHARIQHICQRGSNYNTFFIHMFDGEGEDHLKLAILILPVKHENGISLAGWWWPNIECWQVCFSGNTDQYC